jgi:hypothetical protein
MTVGGGKRTSADARQADVAWLHPRPDHRRMHPIPPVAEMQFLVGLEVGQICLDPWGTQLRFEGGGRISIYGAFEHIDVSGSSHSHQIREEQDRAPVFLRDLMQQSIVSVDATETLLTLSFANGARVRIQSEVGPYETAVIEPSNPELEPLVF